MPNTHQPTASTVQKAENVLRKYKDQPTHAVGTVAKRFKSLNRRRVVELAEKAGINPATASTAYYAVKAGRFNPPLLR